MLMWGHLGVILWTAGIYLTEGNQPGKGHREGDVFPLEVSTGVGAHSGFCTLSIAEL